MSAFLSRLGRSCARHPFRVLGAWLVVAISILAVQGAAGGRYDNRIRIPGVEAQRAASRACTLAKFSPRHLHISSPSPYSPSPTPPLASSRAPDAWSSFIPSSRYSSTPNLGLLAPRFSRV